MAILPRLEQFLESNHVHFTHHVHATVYTAREVATVEHVPEHRIAKTVVYSGNEGYGIAVLPADYVVDMQELRAALGLNRVRLATEKELAELFDDCDLGAMPPFGLLYDMPTFLESGLADEEQIAFNAGTHKDVIYMSMKDFRRLARPTLVHFSRLTAA
jgi:Ala-tRNA(Pro) deacylase